MTDTAHSCVAASTTDTVAGGISVRNGSPGATTRGDWQLLEQPLHGGIKQLVDDLNRAYRKHSALWTTDSTPQAFSWINAGDASGNVLSFLRHGIGPNDRPTVLACVANFAGTPKRDYPVGLPFAGRWREVLNTDAEIYGGSGVGNFGAVEAEPRVWHGRPASAVPQLPPSGVLWLAPPEDTLRSVPADASDAAAWDAQASAEPGQRPPTGTVMPVADVAAEAEADDSSTRQ